MGIFDRLKRPADPTPAAAGPAAPSEGKKPGLLAKFRQGLKKTTQLLNTDIRDLFKAEGRLVDEAFLEDLRTILVKTDMGPAAANETIARVGTKFRARIVHMDDILTDVKSTLKELMAQTEAPLQLAAAGLTVIMVVGVNGSGKTTSIAKLAQLFISQGKKVVLGAGDTFRAAAVEQLTIWAGRLGAEIVKGKPGSDPASVAFAAVSAALANGADICIVDTAGRLQTQQNLMNELTKIQRVITKHLPEAPHEVLLVLDATAGQNAISQAKGFTEAVKCTGIVLSKIDGTAKGGVVIPIRQQFRLPVRYVGVGEQAEDLALFQSDAFVEALFSELPGSVSA